MMVGVQKRKIQWAISLLLVMLYFSGLTAQAQDGGVCAADTGSSFYWLL